MIDTMYSTVSGVRLNALQPGFAAGGWADARVVCSVQSRPVGFAGRRRAIAGGYAERKGRSTSTAATAIRAFNIVENPLHCRNFFERYFSHKIQAGHQSVACIIC